MAVLKSIGLLLSISFIVVTSGSWLNSPPVIDVANHYQVSVDSTLLINFKVSDEDGDSVRVLIDSMPSWLTFDANQFTLNGKPELWDKGHHEIHLQATDGKVTRKKVVDVSVSVPFTPGSLLATKLHQYFRDTTQGLVGVSAAIITPEGKLLTATEGRKSHSSRKALDINVQYRIASITKTFTAVLCLRLAEEGLLNLDAPMAKYINVSGVPYGQKITIRQLLNHTSGLIDHLNRNDFYTGNWKTRRWDHSAIVRYTANRRSKFPPGTNYAYSNTGYYFLGTIIEKVTQKSLADAFDSWIIQPLELKNTFYDDYSTASKRISGLAENDRSYEYHLSAVGTAGAMISTPSDVAKFGAAIYNGTFLSPEFKQAMVTDYTTHLGGDEYGLGTRMWEDYGIYHLGHTGTLMDYRSVLMYIPEKRVTIALSTNQRHRRWYRLVNGLLRDVYWYF